MPTHCHDGEASRQSQNIDQYTASSDNAFCLAHKWDFRTKWTLQRCPFIRRISNPVIFGCSPDSFDESEFNWNTEVQQTVKGTSPQKNYHSNTRTVNGRRGGCGGPVNSTRVTTLFSAKGNTILSLKNLIFLF